MAGRLYVSKFSPMRTDREIRERIFVQRHDLARDAVERIAISATTESKHHLLFVGPRGSGKSHLAALLADRLGAREDLRDRLRIARLNEDETSTSFVSLLRRIFRALVEAYPGEFSPPEEAVLTRLDGAGRSKVLIRALVEGLAGKTLLVVVENLDELLETLGREGQMQWRAFLQEEAMASILATSPRLTDEVTSRQAPFFNTFQTVHLHPLELGDAVTLLENLADVGGNTELAAFLRTPTGRSRVQAIHHLSGGNHRIYIVLSEFISRDALDELVGAFESMLDELTPYYQERIKSLSPQQREVVEFLARSRYAVTVKAIADGVLATHQTAASVLKELRERGYVRDRSIGREKRYELAEPLMRLCVEMKEHGRGPVRLLVDFLRAWYDRGQLERHLGRLVDPEIRACVELALKRVERDSLPPELAPLGEEAMDLFGEGMLVEAKPLIEYLAHTAGRALDWLRLGLCHRMMGQWEQAIIAFGRSLEIDRELGPARSERAVALSRLGRWREVLESWDEVVYSDPYPELVQLRRVEPLMRLDNWPEAFEALGNSMEWSAGAEVAWQDRVDEAIRIILASTRDPLVWAERVGRLVEIYDHYGGLGRLGESLVRSLDAVPGQRLDASALRDWREVWVKAAATRPDLELAARMFEVGMRYHETSKRAVLYDLVSVERRIVEQALELEPECDL